MAVAGTSTLKKGMRWEARHGSCSLEMRLLPVRVSSTGLLWDCGQSRIIEGSRLSNLKKEGFGHDQWKRQGCIHTEHKEVLPATTEHYVPRE